MINGVPHTLEEALKLIEQQKTELQNQQKTINEALAEIARLNEQLAIKRAREFASRSEKSSQLDRYQNLLPFDIEDLNIQKPAAEENRELTEETEKLFAEEEKSETETETNKKSKAGRKSVSKTNGRLPKRRLTSST